MTKKFIAFIMSIVMLCSVCSFSVFGGSVKESAAPLEAYDTVTTGSAFVPDGSGTDAVVILDTSGSMSINNRDTAAVEYAETYARKILDDPNSRVALVTFGNSDRYSEAAHIELPLTNDYETFSDAVDSLTFNYDENMGRAFEYAKEILDENGVNEKKEIYLITDAFPVIGESSELDRFAVWETYGVSSSILHHAEWVYNYVKDNIHSQNWYVKTQGVYTNMTNTGQLSFANDFMSALANPPGNMNIDVDVDIDEIITLEPVTETTTEAEEYTETTTLSSGKSSDKAQNGGGGGSAGRTETTTEATTDDSNGVAEEPEEIYEYGALADMPLIETYNINSQSAAVNAVTDMVGRIEADSSIDINNVDVKDELANFADEAIGLSAQATLGDDGAIDAEAISSLADTALSTKAAVEKALSDSGVTLERELLSSVTFNSDGNIQLGTDVTSLPVDNLHIDVPGGGRITLGSQFVEENASDEPIIISFEIEGAEDEDVDTASATSEEDAAENEVADFAGLVGRYTINVASPKVTPVCSISAINGVTTEYQGVKGPDGLAVSKPNNSIRKIQFRPTSSGQYTVTNVTKLDFTDVNSLSSTQRDTLRKLYAHGLVEGKTATTFAPQTTLTRAEFTTLLLKTIGAYDPGYTGKSGFKDMNGVWSEPIVAKAKNLGIIAGYDSDNTFRPDNKLNNEQLYHMLGVTYTKVNSRAAAVTSSQVSSEISRFADAANIGQWARQNIAVSMLSGFYTSGTSGNFNPRNEVTRYNAAISINRLFERAPFEGRWN